MHTLHQQIDAVSVAGRGRHHRHTQFSLEHEGFQSDPLTTRFVHEIHANNRAVGNLQYLENKVQVALKHRRIAHDHRAIRLTKQHEIARDLFVNAVRQQGVRPWQIDQLETLPPVSERPFRARHGLARPVARVLAQAGQAVENRALARVGVPRQRDHVIVAVVGKGRSGPRAARPAAYTRRNSGMKT